MFTYTEHQTQTIKAEIRDLIAQWQTGEEVIPPIIERYLQFRGLNRDNTVLLRHGQIAFDNEHNCYGMLLTNSGDIFHYDIDLDVSLNHFKGALVLEASRHDNDMDQAFIGLCHDVLNEQTARPVKNKSRFKTKYRIKLPTFRRRLVPA